VISPDGTRLYVRNSDSTISVIDTASNAPVATIPTSPIGQTLSYGLAISPDGATLYALTDFLSFEGILLIDTATDKITGAIPLKGDLAEIAVSPDGLNAYVAGNTNQSFLIVVDLPAGKEIAPIPAYQPYGVKVSPDGQFLYTGTTNNPSINVFNRATGGFVSSTPVAGTLGLALNADGSTLYATGPSLTVYDTPTQSVIAVIDTGGPTLGVAAQ
jgi:YVTN family beta-propeller protein